MSDTDVMEHQDTPVAPDAPTTSPADRAAALQVSRAAKMDKMFKGRKFVVEGEVHLEGNQRFQTPFGNKGRNGFILRETDTGGQEPVSGPGVSKDHRFIVGASLLQIVADEYKAVTIPDKVRKRRTAEEKAADDTKAAIAKAEKLAAKDQAKAEKLAAREAAKAAKAKASNTQLVDPLAPPADDALTGMTSLPGPSGAVSLAD